MTLLAPSPVPVEPKPERRRDAYDDAVDFLVEHPEKAYGVWSDPRSHSCGCLFRIAHDESDESHAPGACGCGCPEMVRHGDYKAQTRGLTEAIRKSDVPSIHQRRKWNRQSFESFAAVQRLTDRALERMPPQRMKEATP